MRVTSPSTRPTPPRNCVFSRFGSCRSRAAAPAPPEMSATAISRAALFLNSGHDKGVPGTAAVLEVRQTRAVVCPRGQHHVLRLLDLLFVAATIHQHETSGLRFGKGDHAAAFRTPAVRQTRHDWMVDPLPHD